MTDNKADANIARNIYALLLRCSPELIIYYQSRLPPHELVAGKLINSATLSQTTICVTGIDDKNYNFDLDINSQLYQSKGNWIWIKHIAIYMHTTRLFSIPIVKPRVIDLPYNQHRVCAHQLFKDIADELRPVVDAHLTMLLK